MDMSSPPGAGGSPDFTAPGNLEILAHTAASQASDLHGAGETPPFHGFPVFKLSDTGHHGLPMLYSHIKTDGQPGGPMLSQAQIQKIFGGPDPKEAEKRASPLSIITTTFSDPGQVSPAAPSQSSQILNYGSSNVAGDAMLSAINYNDNEILHDGAFDVPGHLGSLDDGLLGGMSNQRLTENASGHTFDLFDGEGDSLHIEAFSPIMSDSGGLGGGSAMGEANESSSSADLSIDEKKKVKSKGKSSKLHGQLSPGKPGQLQCNQCNKLFNNSSALAKHKLTHSAERKFLCTICEKKFKRQDHLNGHLMTHRDKKPYQCTVPGCTKSYCDARSLRRHLENHHQHTVEQIAIEMVKAQSMAAEVLADVTASTGMAPQTTSATNPKSSTEPNSAKSETITGAKISSTMPVTVTNTLVTKTQYVPVPVVSSAIVTTSYAVVSPQPHPTQAPQSHIFPYDIIVQQQQKLQKEHQQQVKKQQQQHLKQEKQHLKQQQQQKEIQQQEQRLKQEKEQQELKINLIHEEIKAAVQREQQQQKHVVSSSPKSAWQDPRLVQNNFGSHPNSQPGSGLQSPSSGESQSPGYTALSPSVGGHQPQSPIRSPAQLLYSSPQGTSIAMTVTQSTQSAVEGYSEELVKPISCNVCKKRFKTLPALNGHLRLHGGKDSTIKEERKKKEKNPLNPGKAATTTSSNVMYSSTTLPQPANGTTQLAQVAGDPAARASQFRRPGQSPVQSPPVQQDRDAQAQLNLQLIQQYQQQIQQHQEQLEQQKQQELQIQQQLQEQLQQQIENGNLDIQQIVQLQMAQQQQQQHKLTPLDIQQLQQLQLQQQQEKQLQLQRQQEQQLEQQQQQHARMMEQVQISTPSPQVPSSPHIGVPSSPHIGVPSSPLIARSPHPAQSHMLQRQSSVDSVQSPLQSPPVHPPPPYQLVRPSMGQEQEIQRLNSGGGDYLQQIQNQLQTQNSNVLHSGIGHVNFDPRTSSYHDNSVIRQDTFLGQQDRLNPEVSASNQTDDINTLDNITEVLNKIEGEEQAKRQARSVHPQEVENILSMNRLNSASVTNSIAHFSGKPFSHSVQNPVYSSDTAVSISQGDTHSIDLLHNYHVKPETIQHIPSKPSAIRAAQERSLAFQNNSLAENNGSVDLLQHNNHSNVPYSPMSPIRESADFFAPVSPIQTKNVEIKRRLSAGPEDFMSNRSTYSSSSFSKENISGTYIKPIQTIGANRPRMRSKSGEDHKLLRWRSEEDHSFMKPKTRFDEGSHRPRSKTDEHLSKWNNKDILSRSDGAGVFRNPTSFPSSFKIKRKNRPAPLIIPPHQNHCGFQSRLRSPRVWFEGADISHSVTVPYTPPPMLSPVRQGSGLFWSLSGSFPTSAGGPPPTPRSATQSLIRSASIKTEEGVKTEGAPPESDVLPHVNIGSQYQAALPEFNANKSVAQHSPCKEDLLWDPSLMVGVSDEDVQLYQDLACCAAVKANGANVEHALHLLYLAKGNIQNAMLMLMTGSVSLPSSHSLINYRYQENETWSSDDIENYTQAIFKHDKDFFSVANEMKTKSVKQCIQFYYLWKKVLPDDHKRLRVMRRKREQLYNLRSRQQAEQQKPEAGATVVVNVTATATATEAIVEEEPEAMAEAEVSDSESSISGTAEDQNTENNEDEELTEAAMSDSPTAMPQNIPSPIAVPPVQQAFTCDYPECNSSFSSKPALNAHLKIHMHNSKPPGRASPAELTTKSHGRPRKRSPSAARASAPKEPQEEGVFPCKLCGRVFSKVKSRSAHMKIHRPDQDKEKEKKAKAANRHALLAQKPLQLDPFELPLPNGPLHQ